MEQENNKFKKGRLIIISGPSGVGKSTILHMLLKKYSDKVKFSISSTSRKIREGEVDGIDYNFITRQEFLDKIEDDDFVEWAEVHDNFYGTSKKFIDSIINEGMDCILDIDVQGGYNMMQKYPDAIYIFIAPPDIEALRERLLHRSTDSIDIIKKRVDNAKKEMKYKDKYQYVIVNDELAEAFKKLENILYGNKDNKNNNK